MSATLYDSVRAYISRGFRPIPVYGIVADWCECGLLGCKERDHGKHERPNTDGTWKDGDVSFGPSDFGEHSNVALAMGPQPDGRWLVALDADGDFDWSPLGKLPPTLTQKSPRGEHRIFEVEPFAPLGNWVDVFQDKPDPSLDLRYARGRIIVSPSRNAFGKYQWLDERDPAPLPALAISMILDARVSRGLPVQEYWARDGKVA